MLQLAKVTPGNSKANNFSFTDDVQFCLQNLKSEPAVIKINIIFFSAIFIVSRQIYIYHINTLFDKQTHFKIIT